MDIILNKANLPNSKYNNRNKLYIKNVDLIY